MALDSKDCYTPHHLQTSPQATFFSWLSLTQTQNHLGLPRHLLPFCLIEPQLGRYFTSSAQAGVLEIPVNAILLHHYHEGSLGQKGLELPQQNQRLRPAAPTQSFLTAWDNQAPPTSHSFLSAGNLRQHIHKVCQNWTIKCTRAFLEERMRMRLKDSWRVLVTLSNMLLEGAYQLQ